MANVVVCVVELAAFPARRAIDLKDMAEKERERGVERSRIGLLLYWRAWVCQPRYRMTEVQKSNEPWAAAMESDPDPFLQ